MNTQKLINAMIENEFRHISEHHENEDIKNNKEMVEEERKAAELFKKLEKSLSKEQMKLFNKYDDEMTYFNVDLMRYYFKKGVESAFNGLECLKEYSNTISY